MDASECPEGGGAVPQPATAQHHHTQHSTPEGAQHPATGTVDVQSITFTPDSQFDSQQLLQTFNGPPVFSQDLMLGGTQTQDCSLQQEMLKAERESAERHQTREQEAAAALREEAAQADPSAAVVPDPLLSAQVAGADFLGRHSSGGMPANDPAAAAAAGGGVSEDLLKLAQVAFDQEQGQQGVQDPYAAMQQFDPAAWAAYGGMAGMGGMNAAMLTNYYWGQPMGMPSAYPSQRHPSLSKPEHQGSNAKRRGPMDEMRQLQRILTKLLPGSIIYMPNQDGGGNKVQADDIKVYIAATLGEAPKPDWGLKNGWGQYLADLFNWATGREGDNAITRTQAMSCARRPQGRSWEVVFDKLMELGVYSWNWELPLRHEQVLNCHKTPPPELTRQQEALAAATAAAAAAAAVTAGANPDAIPNLPVVARMASLLGKRQHQQMSHMGGMGMGPPPMMFGGMHMDGGGDMMAAAAAAAAMPSPAAAAAGAAAVTEGGEATATQEPATKKQRSSSSPGAPAPSEVQASSDGAAAAAAAAAPAVTTAPTHSNTTSAAAAGGGVGISDAQLAVPPLEVLQAASIQQLMTFVDNALTGALQATQGKVLSGTARCPSMEYIMNMKNFKLDPLYASYISLVMQAGSAQSAMEQHMAQQTTMQQAKAQVKSEAAATAAAAAAASSSRGMGRASPAALAAAPVPPAAAAPAATLASAVPASSAGPASSAVRLDAAAAAAAVQSGAQGEQDSAAVAAAMAAAAAAAASMAPAAAVAAAAAKLPAVVTQAAAAKALGKKKSSKAAAARDAQQDYVQQAKQQSAVQEAAAEAAMAAAARLQQQKQVAPDPAEAAIAAYRLRQSLDGYAVADKDSEDAAMAAAMALSALAGSQEVPEGVDMDYQAAGGRGQAGGVAKRRVGGSRLANGSGRAAHTSPMKPR